MTDTVTFQTTLVPARETPRAYCVLGGTWLPKSQVKIEEVLFTRTVDGGIRYGKKLKPIECIIVKVTVPKWLLR